MREIILALAMETKFSKAQILELYLNKVYFGGGAYGVDAASRRFFDHGAENLTLAEAAIIAGLVKAPSRYSPTADAKAALGRAGVVVAVMQDAGMITAAEAASVKPSLVKMAAEPPQDSVRYFTDWALPQLDGLIDETEKPIDVWTTLDLKMQRAATAAIVANVPRGTQGALVAIDRDGAVKAMVGGTDYVSSNYNRAVTSVRQPGSAWKLFVYLTALEAGFRPEDKVVDEPVEIDGWQPRNSGGNYAGEITVRTAFAYSKNTVAAQIGQEVGTSSIANMARRFGITTPVNTLPSMVLGTSDVRVIDMTRAFAAVQAKRPQRHTIRDFESHNHRRRSHLFRQAAKIDPAGRGLGCGGNDRPDANRRRHRHRNVLLTSAALSPARPAPPAVTRTAGSWASPAA